MDIQFFITMIIFLFSVNRHSSSYSTDLNLKTRKLKKPPKMSFGQKRDSNRKNKLVKCGNVNRENSWSDDLSGEP